MEMKDHGDQALGDGQGVKRSRQRYYHRAFAFAGLR